MQEVRGRWALGPFLPLPKPAVDSAGRDAAATEVRAGSGYGAAGKRAGLAGKGGPPTRPMPAATAALPAGRDSRYKVNANNVATTMGNYIEADKDQWCSYRGAENAEGDSALIGLPQERKEILEYPKLIKELRGTSALGKGALENAERESCTRASCAAVRVCGIQQNKDQILKNEVYGLNKKKIAAQSAEKQQKTDKNGPNPPCCTGH